MVVPPPRPAPPSGALTRRAEAVRAWMRWYGTGRLILGAVAIAAVILGGLWVIRTPDPEALSQQAREELRAATYVPVPPTEYTVVEIDAPPEEPEADSAAEAEDGPWVHVVGAVVAPGVYPLEPGARVIDALRAAGGPIADAAVDAMNLAAVVIDGQRVQVPTAAEVRSGAYRTPEDSAGDPSAAAASRAATSGLSGSEASRIDINRAGPEELTRLPGVGPVTAAAIVADREARGPFTRVEDLLRVRGIGPAKLSSLRPFARV